MTKKIKVNWNAMTPAMIDPAIDLNGVNSETLQLRVHKVLIAIAADWQDTTDQKTAVQRVNRQIDKLADGVRKQAIVAWVTSPKHFGMLVKTEEVPTQVAGKSKTVKSIAAGKMKAKNLDMNFLVNSHWWLFTKEPEFKAFDLQVDITKLLVRADAVVKRADKRQKPIPASILTALREVEKMTVKV
jgi:hypothetical protein